jgi:hypothetical protein
MDNNSAQNPQANDRTLVQILEEQHSRTEQSDNVVAMAGHETFGYHLSEGETPQSPIGSTLTSTYLQPNEIAQPEISFEYRVYQGQNSGYNLLDKLLGWK